ncbi:MAG: Thymidylate synthase [Candidatus Taylorbacteria bacterium]|nr:Thymidylate synthase [Candidatus Taylorbacteria bacterium]
MTKFDTIYKNLVEDIMTNGVEELSERTGHKTRTVLGAHFSIDLEKDGFPLLTLRKIPIKMFVSEQIWFISGSRKVDDFLSDYTKIWDDFTNPNGVITVAYGYRWRKHFGRDQLALLINLLKNEPSTRQGVIVTWDPTSDGLTLEKKKNVPCPFAFTVNIVGGRLHLHNIVRSNDIMLGMPADVPGFALLQCILAQKLGVRPGIYSHSISNAHIYDTHYAGAQEIMKRTNDHKKIELVLPENSFDRAEQKDKALVEEIFNNLVTQHTPMEPITGMKVVV